jgi:hypothetical protein
VRLEAIQAPFWLPPRLTTILPKPYVWNVVAFDSHDSGHVVKLRGKLGDLSLLSLSLLLTTSARVQGIKQPPKH